MRRIRCPYCETAKRPYGIPREPNGRYRVCTFSFPCSGCGRTIFVRMDYVLELAPVQIKDAWVADGTPAEVFEEKRGAKSIRMEGDEDET